MRQPSRESTRPHHAKRDFAVRDFANRNGRSQDRAAFRALRTQQQTVRKVARRASRCRLSLGRMRWPALTHRGAGCVTGVVSD